MRGGAATTATDPKKRPLHGHSERSEPQRRGLRSTRSVEKIRSVDAGPGAAAAMKDLSGKFTPSKLILPFVLQCGRGDPARRRAAGDSLDRIKGRTKGKVTIATVFGDVRDIGKSLVDTILRDNGYTVVDLGGPGPDRRGGQRHRISASQGDQPIALLVSTSKQMPAYVQELHLPRLEYPVLIERATIGPATSSLPHFTPSGKESDGRLPAWRLLRGHLGRARHGGRAGRRRGAQALVDKVRSEGRNVRDKPEVVDRFAATTNDSTRSAPFPTRRASHLLGVRRGRDRPRRRVLLTSSPHAVRLPAGAGAAEKGED